MPRLLAIDSSGDIFSAAAGAAGASSNHPVAVRSGAPQTPHAACALPVINALLDEQGYALADCDAFAFAAGPGKFSALRLSCALARTFAYACGKPLLAAPGFCALAQENYGSRPLTVKCALPAHQGHIYFAVCENSGGRWQVRRAELRGIDAGVPAPAVRHACGGGYRQYPQLLGDAEYNEKAAYSSAAAVWQIADTMLTDGAASDPLTCAPFYLRRQVAETIHQRQCSRNSSKN